MAGGRTLTWQDLVELTPEALLELILDVNADTGAIETADDGEASSGNGRIAFLPPAEASHLSVAPHPLG